jgi:thioesterase domain-containing protein
MWRRKSLKVIRSTGTGIPVVCVHGDEANDLIPKYLSADHPFFAFKHQGTDRTRVRYDKVEAIASAFIAELKEVRPKGPYVLCGYSFGGIVAYEMAQQLLRAGDVVPMLGLIDSYSPGLHVQAMRSDGKIHVGLKRRLLRAALKPFLRKDRRIPARLHHFHLIDTYDRAVKAYAPLPYTGHLVVFKAEEAWGPEDLGWLDLAPNGVDIEIVPGDHYNLIKEPHVGKLARKIESMLNEIQAHDLK